MDDKKLIYFAHPILHYNTPYERVCIEKLEKDFDAEVFNPNQTWLSRVYQLRKDDSHEEPFGIFKEIARACDIIVATTFFDGEIGAGVYNEAIEGLGYGKKVYVLEFNGGGYVEINYQHDFNKYKVLSIAETRERIKEKRA